MGHTYFAFCDNIERSYPQIVPLPTTSSIQQVNTSMNFSLTSSNRETVLLVFELCIFFLLNIAALVGNTLVCIAFYRNKSLRKVTNYFVLSLALADLFMAIMVMPLTGASSMTQQWVGGEFGCQLNQYCANYFAGTSLLTVLVLAVNRYVRVVRPAQHKIIFSKKRSVTIIVCAWSVTIVMSVCSFLINKTQRQTFATQPASCFQFFSDNRPSKINNSAGFTYIVLPGLVIVLCYVKIFRTIRRHNTAATPSAQGGHSAYGVEEAKMTKILTFLVVGFYFCWLPVLAFTVLVMANATGEAVFKYFNFYYTFPIFASSVINPIVYAILNRSFRNEFLKILHCKRSLFGGSDSNYSNSRVSQTQAY